MAKLSQDQKKALLALNLPATEKVRERMRKQRAVRKVVKHCLGALRERYQPQIWDLMDRAALMKDED